MRKKGKKYQDAAKLVEDKVYSLAEAVELIKKVSIVKFDATIGVSFNLGIDPKQADQQLRGAIVLPNGSGKSKTVLAITQKVGEAKEAGADFVGGKDMLEKIKNENWFGFDVIVATPDMMGELGKLGKLLGPKGLMPNPKSGTVTFDVAKAIQEIKAGKVEYRVDKTAIVHCPIGKKSFGTEKLKENFSALMEALVKAKPAAAKGQYIKSVSVSSTMGPGAKINPTKVLD